MTLELIISRTMSLEEKIKKEFNYEKKSFLFCLERILARPQMKRDLAIGRKKKKGRITKKERKIVREKARKREREKEERKREREKERKREKAKLGICNKIWETSRVLQRRKNVPEVFFRSKNSSLRKMKMKTEN